VAIRSRVTANFLFDLVTHNTYDGVMHLRETEKRESLSPLKRWSTVRSLNNLRNARSQLGVLVAMILATTLAIAVYFCWDIGESSNSLSGGVGVKSLDSTELDPNHIATSTKPGDGPPSVTEASKSGKALIRFREDAAECRALLLKKFELLDKIKREKPEAAAFFEYGKILRAKIASKREERKACDALASDTTRAATALFLPLAYIHIADSNDVIGQSTVSGLFRELIETKKYFAKVRPSLLAAESKYMHEKFVEPPPVGAGYDQVLGYLREANTRFASEFQHVYGQSSAEVLRVIEYIQEVCYGDAMQATSSAYAKSSNELEDVERRFAQKYSDLHDYMQEYPKESPERQRMGSLINSVHLPDQQK
jgi:hypothetical protein